MRTSGILMPIFSLPSKYGIGCASKEAYEFVDFLKRTGQTYWQILPIGPTSYGDSPYQSFSTFAGNPYFIDLEQLIKEGLLTKKQCDGYDFGSNEEYIDYEKLYFARFELLKAAFLKADKEEEAYVEFKANNKTWLADYSLFMALKDFNDGISWLEWPMDMRMRDSYVMEGYQKELAEEIEYYSYVQYLFFKQWIQLKTYANDKGIKIVGDIPIYVAGDSADTWANPGLFQFKVDGSLKAVAGCPPDAFAVTGQLWGNPLYDWKVHKAEEYRWWIQRILHCELLFDVIRVDHFRGFDEYYSIPAKDKTAEFGTWKKGPGYDLFKHINKNVKNLDFIAEDLGFLTDSVRDLVEKTGYPGMKILIFGFDPYGNSEYLPHNYGKNSIAYTGTHDNETAVGYFMSQNFETKKFILDYLNIPHEVQVEKVKGKKVSSILKEEEIVSHIHLDLIRSVMMSVSNTCIIPFQDYLGMDNSARINIPSTVGGNWGWRATKKQFTKELEAVVLQLTKISSRDRVEMKKDDLVVEEK